MNELLFMDVESGGLDPDKDALLTVGLVRWVDGEIKETEEILIQPEGLNLEPRALQVNGINMTRHRVLAIPRHQAKYRIQGFVQTAFPHLTYRHRVVLGGHNISFDIAFVRKLFGLDWNKLVSSRSIDTAAILRFLGHCGVLPEVSGLDQAIKYFGIEVPEGQRHTALGDAIATARVYTELVNNVMLDWKVANAEELVWSDAVSRGPAQAPALDSEGPGVRVQTPVLELPADEV